MVPKHICIDFDGTLCDFSFPGIGKIKEGAVEALQSFRDMGYHIIIYSCRTCSWFPEIFAPDDGLMGLSAKAAVEMKAWLDVHKVPYDEIDDGLKGKPMAEFYVDDKGVRFSNNWPLIANFIKDMQ